MKKTLALILAVCLLVCIGISASAAPQLENDMFEKVVLCNLDGRKEGVIISLASPEGYAFSDAMERREYKDGAFVISELEGINQVRIDFYPEEAAEAAKYHIKDYDAIGFYFENNSEDEVGLSFFGEMTNSNGTCQLTYSNCEYYSNVYLVYTDGTVVKGEEYLDDYGHSLTAIPANFKGWFMVTVDTVGHDYCYYKSFGAHSNCNEGELTDDSTLFAGGMFLCAGDDDGYNYVFDDYMLVKFNDNFKVTDKATEQPTQKPTQQATTKAPTGSATVAPAASATAAPSAGLPTGALIGIIAGGVVIIAAVVVIIVVSGKKKKA